MATNIPILFVTNAIHQYYAVNKAVESTLRASAINADFVIRDDLINYGLSTVKNQPTSLSSRLRFR